LIISDVVYQPERWKIIRDSNSLQIDVLTDNISKVSDLLGWISTEINLGKFVWNKAEMQALYQAIASISTLSKAMSGEVSSMSRDAVNTLGNNLKDVTNAMLNNPEALAAADDAGKTKSLGISKSFGLALSGLTFMLDTMNNIGTVRNTFLRQFTYDQVIGRTEIEERLTLLTKIADTERSQIPTQQYDPAIIAAIDAVVADYYARKVDAQNQFAYIWHTLKNPEDQVALQNVVLSEAKAAGSLVATIVTTFAPLTGPGEVLVFLATTDFDMAWDLYWGFSEDEARMLRSTAALSLDDLIWSRFTTSLVDPIRTQYPTLNWSDLANMGAAASIQSYCGYTVFDQFGKLANPTQSTGWNQVFKKADWYLTTFSGGASDQQVIDADNAEATTYLTMGFRSVDPGIPRNWMMTAFENNIAGINVSLSGAVLSLDLNGGSAAIIDRNIPYEELSRPNSPTALIANAVSTSQINLTWQDNSTDETGFKIEQSITGSGFTQIGTVGSGVTSYSSTGLSPCSTYWYRVRAYNSLGKSDYANVASAKTLGCNNTLVVNITPQAAIDAGAKWQVNGGALRGSGTSASLAPGTYTVTFQSLAGWDTPITQYVTVTDGQSITLNANYVLQSASLQVFIEPAGAQAAGARWRVAGGAWHKSGELVTDNLPWTQDFYIQFKDVSGWFTPPPQAVLLNAITPSAVRTGAYVPMSSGTGNLVISILPTNAATSGTQWRVDGGDWKNSGEIVQGLSSGSHIVDFNAITGYVGPANQTININGGNTTTNLALFSLSSLCSYVSPGQSIQTAIDNATAGQTVILNDGTYPVSSTVNLSKGVVLRSLHGPVNSMIAMQVSGPSCLTVNDTNAVVDGIGITGANVNMYQNAGGVALSQGMLLNCKLYGNIAGYGGGAACGDNTTVYNCWIENNTAWRGGGGLYLFGASHIFSCVIKNNVVNNDYEGGGVYAGAGVVYNCLITGNTTGTYGDGAGGSVWNAVIDHCVVIANIANDSGGGLTLNDGAIVRSTTIANNKANMGGGFYHAGKAIVRVENCNILGNQALTDYGGGGWCDSGLVLSNCVVSGNSSAKGGGGFGTFDGFTAYNTVISNNTAQTKGGGVYAEYPIHLVNCLLCRNSATSDGGGIWLSCGTGSYLQNCTVSYNQSGSIGGGVYWDGGCSSASLSSRNTIVMFNSATTSDPNYTQSFGTIAFSYSCAAPLPSGAGNINSDPLFVNPGVNDFHLAASSPCIDTGTLSGAPVVDLDGVSRPQDGNGDGVAQVDMGAYEYAAPVTRIIGFSGNLAFGSVMVGATPQLTMSITNAGNSLLTVSGIIYPAGFSGWGNGSIGIAPGSSTNIAVTFTPAVFVAYGGTITVNSDATGGISTNSVSGTGMPAPCVILATPSITGLSCGSLITNTTPTLSWTDVTNESGYVVTLYSGGSCTGSPIYTSSQLGANTTSYPIANGVLSIGRTYSWRVQAKGDGTIYCDSSPSTCCSFSSTPAQATSPTPASGAMGQSVTTQLNWANGGGATSYDLSFGTNNPPVSQGNQIGMSYNPGTLNYNTTYYWRIDAKNSVGTTTGIVWSLTTQILPVLSTIGFVPASLSCTTTQGQNAASQTYQVWNSGGGTLSYSNAAAATWLSVSPPSGSSTGNTNSHIVTYSTLALTAGVYNATINITSTNASNSPQPIPVSLTVVTTNAPLLGTKIALVNPDYYRILKHGLKEGDGLYYSIANGTVADHNSFTNPAAWTGLGQSPDFLTTLLTNAGYQVDTYVATNFPSVARTDYALVIVQDPMVEIGRTFTTNTETQAADLLGSVTNRVFLSRLDAYFQSGGNLLVVGDAVRLLENGTSRLNYGKTVVAQNPANLVSTNDSRLPSRWFFIRGNPFCGVDRFGRGTNTIVASSLMPTGAVLSTVALFDGNDLPHSELWSETCYTPTDAVSLASVRMRGSGDFVLTGSICSPPVYQCQVDCVFSNYIGYTVVGGRKVFFIGSDTLFDMQYRNNDGAWHAGQYQEIKSQVVSGGLQLIGNLVAAATNETAVVATGAITVTILPPTAVAAGARWQVDGGSLLNSGASTNGLGVGTHTVHFNTVSGWTSPGDQAVNIANGLTTTATGIYAQVTATISVQASPTNGGMIDGAGLYPFGTNVQITANANSCWTFVNWSDGNASAIRVITVPASNTTYTANFTQQLGMITVQTSPDNGGIVTGGGPYLCGSSQQVSANANSCWRFTGWNDGQTNTTRAVTVPASNITYTANFTQQSGTITVQASSGGNVSGGGTALCGSNVTVSATPATCYQLVNWTEGEMPVSTSTNYTFVLAGNRTLVAHFARIPYTITTIASPLTGGTTSGNGTIPCGSNVTVSATNNVPYQFIAWTENSNVVNTNTSYNFTVMTNRDLVALFDQAPIITVAPSVTNALLIISNRTVVVAGETNTFNVVAIDPDGDALKYQWVFGDGITNDWSSSALTTHTYVSSNCGPYTASVTVSDGNLTASSNLAVMAACDFLAITKLQVGLNFTKLNADTISLTAKLGLPGFTNVSQLAGFSVIADVGDAQVPFTLNNKGRGVSVNGTCGLAYTKPTKKLGGYWTATISLSKGTWRNQWAKFGLDNTPHKSPGKTMTLPVVVLINNEAFAAEPTLHYIATLKTGTAK